MKIRKVSIENFRNHAATTLAFPASGSIGLIGSNESGKSTVLEAIAWALYGSEAMRGNKEDLRWWGAPARHTASVTLWFSLADREYRIERGENNARLYLAAGESEELIAERLSVVDSEVPKILQMSYKEFVSTFMCEQKELDRIAKMGATERVAFIREVLDMGRIDTGLKAARKKRNEVGQELHGMTAGMGDPALVRAEAEEAEARLGRDREEVARLEEIADAHAEVLEYADEALASAEAEVDAVTALRDQLARNRAKVDVANQRIDGLLVKINEAEIGEKRLAELRKQLAGADGARTRLAELREMKSKFVELKGVEEALVTAEKSAEILTEARDKHQEALDVARQELADREEVDPEEIRDLDDLLAAFRQERGKRAARAEAQIATLKKEASKTLRRIEAINKAGRDADCPTCLRSLEDAFDAVMEGLEARMDDVEKEIEQEHGVVTLNLTPTEEEADLAARLKAARDEAREQAELRVGIQTLQSRADVREADLRNREEAVERWRGTIEKLTEATQGLDLDELDRLTGEVQRFSKLEEEVRIRSRASGQMAAWKEERDRLAEEEREHLSYIELGEKELAEIDQARVTEAHEKAVARHTGARNGVQVAAGDLARARGVLEADEGRAEDARRSRERVEALEVKRGGMVKEHHRLELVCTAMEEFRVSIAATIRPELEELMTGFLQVLTDGRTEAVELDEDFGVTAYQSGNAARVVSGGAGDLMSLAMRLALSQMVAEKAGHPLSLLALDEPFGSLDQERRSNVVGLIRTLSGIFEQVVVISHVAETRDAVDHPIELQFDPEAGRTRIVSQPTVEA